MILIGERINASRAPIKAALEKRDAKFIQDEAKIQADAGCQFLDLNCGLSIETEIADMEWLVGIVQQVLKIPLCIDSPNPAVIEKGISLCKAKPLINSITAEEARYKNIILVAKKYNSAIIVLTMDERGMPETSDDRFKIAKKIFGILKKEGIEDGDIYFDPLVRPISSEPKQASELLSSIPKIKSLGGVKIVCGASNISYGLPQRSIINSAFIAMAIKEGLDGALVDPLNKRVFSAIRASEALLARDNYCMNFIQGHRKGLF
ncbi:MAG: dihydropteroate synthase [Candidatus Omnitrophica bacterium]|nr:dihydropteroate synthase [Candidatus Omnitrophota bacterium]